MPSLTKTRRPAVVKGYQRLRVEEVVADLPSLDGEQLRFVQSLEEVAGGRSVVLDRIAALLAPLDEPAPRVIDIRPHRFRRLRIRRLGRVAGIAVVLAVIAAGAGGAIAVLGLQGQASAGASGRPAGSQSATAEMIKPSGVVGDPLQSLALAAVPPGYSQEPDVISGASPSELLNAVMDDGMSGAGSFLGKAGFVHGLRRIWQTGDHHQLTLSIYQFNDTAGASAYRQRRIEKDRSNPQATITDFSVGGIPGAAGTTSEVPGSATVTVSFTKAGYFVQLSANWYSATGLGSLAQDLARDQYRLL